jgi:hypothetical protein
MRLAAAAAVLLALAACAGSAGLKYPQPRLVGQTASFEGCAFRVAFSGSARRLGSAADDLRQDYASSVKKSSVLDEAGFEAADGGTREFAFCRCMRHDVEATASRGDASDALRASFRELAGASAAPVDWQVGTPMGRAARFEFQLQDGRRVYAGTNFSGNCVGAVAAIGGSEPAAKKFVDSRSPL